MVEKSRKLILASASPRRRELLESAGFNFEVVPVDVEEKPIESEKPQRYAVRLATLKALTCARNIAPHSDEIVVLGADTIVVVDDRIMEKPTDEKDATEMLRFLSGRQHTVMTGYCLATSATQPDYERLIQTKVFFRPLAETEIERYVLSGEPMDKAGAYAIQGGAASMVSRIEGSYSNVVGLPLAETAADLARLGVYPS